MQTVLWQGDTVRKLHLVGYAAFTDGRSCNPRHTRFLNTLLHLMEVWLFEYKNRITHSGVLYVCRISKSWEGFQSKWANVKVLVFQIIYYPWWCVDSRYKEDLWLRFICTLFISWQHAKLVESINSFNRHWSRFRCQKRKIILNSIK